MVLREPLEVLANIVVDSAVISDCLVHVVNRLSLWDLLERYELLGQFRHKELEVDIVSGGSQVYPCQLIISRESLLEFQYILLTIES